MTYTLFVAGLTWLLATGVGWVLTGLVDAERRDALRPAAPLFGLVTTILVLRWTSLAVGVDVGVWFVLGVVAVLAAVATWRDRRWWRASWRALGWTALLVAAAAIPAIIAFGPTRAVGDSRVIQPSGNNDAFYYVSTADWLIDHPATDIPVRTADPSQTTTPPSFFPARSQLLAHLRIGQELTHAAVDVVVGRPAVDTWYPVNCLWLLLLPTSGYGVAVALRMRRAAGAGAGVAVAVSAVTVLQFADQNSDALLGMSLMPFAVAAAVASLGARPTVPRWLAGLMLVAAVGTYTEYLPVVGPALLVGLVLRRPSALWAALKRLPLLVAVAAVAGPLIWYDATKSLLYIGGLSSANFNSAFNQVGSGAVLNRVVGATQVRVPFSPQLATPALLTALGIGIVAAALFSRRRWFMLTLAAWPPLLAYYLVEIAQPAAAYTQQRVVGLYLPLLVLVAAFGWDRLLDVVGRLVRERPRAVRRSVQAVTAGIAVLALLSWGLVNARSDRRLDLPTVALRRHVDATFSEAAGWVTSLGGPGGRDVDVLVTEFFNQLWITDALRQQAQVEYPRLYLSYQGVQSFWSGHTRRYLLVDRFTKVDAAPSLIVRSNARFVLLDLSRGPLAAMVAADSYGYATWFLLADPSVRTPVTLRGTIRVRTDKLPSTRGLEKTVPLPPGTLTPTTTSVSVPVAAGTGTVVSLRQGNLEFVPNQIIANEAPR